MANVKYVIDENGNYKFRNPINSTQIIEVASAILKASLIRGECLNNPQTARDYAQLQLGSLESEAFGVLFLDTKHQLIAFEVLFQGTINSASVYPREVVKRVLEHNAAAVIFTHNHPSGLPEPSAADTKITQRLKDALALVDVRVLDHVIVGTDGTSSMAEAGLL